MYKCCVKRVLDILLSSVMILALSSFFLIIILLIAVDSRGPVFFLQERVGKKGKVFKIIKFRTMVDGAEKIGTGIRTSSTDPRITKIGSILRKTSLDELPQLFNVFVGQMSFVGPRPPVTYHPYNGYDSYPDWSKPRFEVLPGITGYAQEEVRNFVPWDERMKYDVLYVEKISFLFDMKIIFKTAANILSFKSVYLDPSAKKTETTERKEETNA